MTSKDVSFRLGALQRPQYIVPYEITEKVGPLAYKLALPSDLAQIHNVFHVSMLRRYRTDPTHVINEQTFDVTENLSYIEEPVEILEFGVKELRNKDIPVVEVLWKHHSQGEATWETEARMRQKYP